MKEAIKIETPLEVEESSQEHKQEKSKVSFEGDMTSDEAMLYLVSLIRGIKGGKVTLRQGDDTVTLEPGGTTAVKVKASSKDRKQKISFELAWRLPADDNLEIA